MSDTYSPYYQRTNPTKNNDFIKNPNMKQAETMSPYNETSDQRHWEQHSCSERSHPTKLMESEMQEVLDLSRRGHEEHSAGNYTEALKLMNEALAIVENKMPETSEVAVILTSIARMLQESGIDSGFKQHWSALQIRMQRMPNTAMEAESHENVGMILLTEHHHGAALRHLQTALSFHSRQNPSSIMTAIQHIHVGQARQNMGHLQEALLSFERALAILVNSKPDSVNVANVHCLLGRVLREQGNLAAAKEQLNQAIEVYIANVPSSLDLANAYADLGRVHGSEGCGQKEMLYYGKALEIQTAQAPDSLEVAKTLHQVAAVHFRAGDFECAKMYLEHAITIRVSLSPQSLELAKSFFCLAELLRKQGDYPNALELHKQSLELRSRIQPLSIDEADSLHAVGQIMEKMGNWQEALNCYSREFLGRDIDATETARVHNTIGNLLLARTNRTGDSICNHRMAVRIQTRHGKSECLVKYLSDLIRALQVKGESTIQLEEQLEEARNISETSCY